MVLGARGETARYEVRGRLAPATRAAVWLHGATAPFEANTLAGDDGRFRFRGIQTGTYILGAFVPGRGELRRTIEVGPSQARAARRIELVVPWRDGEFESRDSLRRAAAVSTADLAIPVAARRAYEDAVKRLERRDAAGAAAQLRRAVEIAPQYAEAWNHLGTIAYQTRDFPRAEACFRKALAAAPNLFQPLVNLGGVLINLNRFDEALQYNLYAALSRPNDALANSQLGITYFHLNQLDLARQYLTAAKRIDPAHFSHPQLILAQIDLRREERGAAAAELEEFVQYHPDAPQAGRAKEDIARLRAPSNPAREFAASGMARSFSEAADLPDGAAAAIGSGRHARVLLKRAGAGWVELPMAGGPGFGFTPACLSCHASAKTDHPGAMSCGACHTGEGKPGQETCLKCHVAASGPESAHRPTAAAEEPFELNSAGYRLLESRCYRASAGKLTCLTCHPPHTFANTVEGYRMACRGCHPTQHNGAALNCNHCHMPRRPAADAPEMMVADHRIQRPL